MKLAAWARSIGVHPKTAYRWFHRGNLPVPAHQLDTGTILITLPQSQPATTAAVYARVSSHDQRPDLDRQVARLTTWAGQHGYAISRIEAEVGSGVSGRRRRLMRLLADPDITTIIIEHRDRLARFGTEYIQAVLTAQGRHLMIADPGETVDDLAIDMVHVLTSFCARMYGRRSARTRALRALTAAKAAPRDQTHHRARRSSR